MALAHIQKGRHFLGATLHGVKTTLAEGASHRDHDEQQGGDERGHVAVLSRPTGQAAASGAPRTSRLMREESSFVYTHRIAIPAV